MVEEEPQRRQMKASPRLGRPGLLIAILAMGEILATVIGWACGPWMNNLYQSVGTRDLAAGLAIGISVFRQGLNFPAWWLAMLVPHSRRSLGWPLVLMAILIIFYRRMVLLSAMANFYSWADIGDALWRGWAWSFSQAGLTTVCIAGPCYLLSRIANLQLIRGGELPRHIPLDTKRLFGLTLVVALAFAIFRWVNASHTYTSPLSASDLATFSALSSVSVGVGWAGLSWAYAGRSLPKIIAVVGVLMMLQYGLGHWVYWFWTSKSPTAGTEAMEPRLMMALSTAVLTSCGILIAIGVAHYCGYVLAFWKRPPPPT